MRIKHAWLCGFLTLLMFIAASGAAYASEMDDVTLAPYFFVEGEDSALDSFPLKETSVVANISGSVADIYVTQAYANDGQQPLNARYVFPASTRVSVHGMTMSIGDNVIRAKIKEREEAKQEFEAAKSEGKSASLLEQERPNVFSMSVANIMPGDTVLIELHYTELVVPTEGVYQFVFPTVVGPRYANHTTASATNQWVASPYLEAGQTPPGQYNITVNLDGGVPLADLSCTSHQVTVQQKGETAAYITLANPEDFAGNRDFILEYKLAGKEVQSGLILYEGETENFFLLMMQPPERVKVEDIPPREYIFVVDVSGSMHGFPLDTAKTLMRKLIANIRDTDTFNVILFSGATQQLSPTSLPATTQNIQKAINMINRQDGGGGTELAPALKSALAIPQDKSASRSIIVVTDGYIAEESAIFDIINKNLGQANFFSFGIGTSVNRYLVDGIAKAGLGEAFVVTNDSEATAAAERLRTYIQSPVLTNIKVSYDNFEVYDVEPSQLPDLFAQRPLILLGKWRGEATGSIKVTGQSGGADYAQVIPVVRAESQSDNAAISYLWARSRVERLMDYGATWDSQDTVKKEVTELGLKYSMMTQYTSFVAVLEKVRNTDKESTDVEQPLPLPLHVSDLAVGGGYGGYGIGSEPGDIMFMLLLCASAASMVLRRHKQKTAAARSKGA